MNFLENFEKGFKWLHTKGAFLTVKSGELINTMTIAWGNIGYEWNIPVFSVLVRKSRYTYELIESARDFTVNIPLDESLKDELVFCGTKSGRDYDKFKECSLKLRKSKNIQSPIIEGCGLYYECEIVGKAPLIPNLLNDHLRNTVYKGNDYHTIYYGRILNACKK
jgi:flavin reductase (DIM6/NTAB) family NADH-FMN oxidoreductase RutF